MLIIGGDSISKYIYDELGKNNINAYITYGMTETSSGVAGYFLNQNDVYQSGYIGSPHNGVKIGLRDKNIFIKSGSVMRGYVNDTYCNNLFITDDIGEVKDEKIYFISRGKDFIVSGGENISLVSIKNIIKNCDGIIDTVVVGCKDDTWGMVPVVLFKGNIEISTLSIFCKKELPKHMLPKHFIRINKIPYINNKIDYNLIQYYVKKSLA
jgi:long-subunit acyl-CoA synthetase (AMP-forming)